MYNRILVPMSLEHGIGPSALQIARRLLIEGGEIIALHIHEVAPGSVRAYLDEALVEKALEDSKQRLKDKIAAESDVQAVTLVGHAGRTIVDYSRETGIDCIVIGSHKPGLSDYFLGSTSARVVRHALCAVHVLRT